MSRTPHRCMLAALLLFFAGAPLAAGEQPQPQSHQFPANDQQQLATMASPGADAPAWSFLELVERTVRSHPQVLGREFERRAAEADLSAARWQRFPTPEVQASRDDDDRETLLFALDQPLWTGGRINAGVNAARARLGASDYAIEEARDEILNRLIRAYTEVLLRQAQYHIHYNNVQEHERLLAMITRRVDQRLSTQTDLELASSRLSQAANDFSRAIQSLNDGLTRLTELTGDDVRAVSLLRLPRGLLPQTREEALELAIAYAPRLARVQKQVEAARADERSARAAYSPVVSLRLEQREQDDVRDRRALISLQSQFEAGLASRSRIAGASARRDSIDQEYQAALREVRAEAAEVWRGWVAARLRLDNSARYRASATSVFESYTRQYVIGQKTWLDVLNSLREATAAGLEHEQASVEVLLAALRLQLLTGTLVAALVDESDRSSDIQPHEPEATAVGAGDVDPAGFVPTDSEHVDHEATMPDNADPASAEQPSSEEEFSEMEDIELEPREREERDHAADQS